MCQYPISVGSTCCFFKETPQKYDTHRPKSKGKSEPEPQGKMKHHHHHHHNNNNQLPLPPQKSNLKRLSEWPSLPKIQRSNVESALFLLPTWSKDWRIIYSDPNINLTKKTLICPLSLSLQQFHSCEGGPAFSSITTPWIGPWGFPTFP